MISQCPLCEELRIDERDDRGRLGGRAPGNRSLNGPFRRRRPAKIAHVPRTVWQRRRVDSRNILDVQKFHTAPSFGVAAYAIGIEEVAFGGVSVQTATVGDDYSKMREDVAFRLEQAETVGLGFALPSKIAEDVPAVRKMK